MVCLKRNCVAIHNMIAINQLGVVSVHLSLLFAALPAITGIANADEPCPSNVTGVSPFRGGCVPVCWHDQAETGAETDPRVTYRSHQPSSYFGVGRTEVTYRYNMTTNVTGECRFNVTVRNPCLSGTMDAITRTSDGNTYTFFGNKVIKIITDSTEKDTVADGYPKLICAVFPGLPSNLDAAVYWPNKKTYFFKEEFVWTSTGTSIESQTPRLIAEVFQGVPSDVDAAVVWPRNGFAYFFKDNIYWRFRPSNGRVDGVPQEIISGWPGIGVPVDAAFEWDNVRTYFFSGEDYWRYNDFYDRADSEYPLRTTKGWFGCPTDEEDPPTVSVSDVCVSECTDYPVPSCLKAHFDAVTYISDCRGSSNIFVFRGEMVARLTPAAGDIDYGFPRPICSVFPGLPPNLDAALTWKDTGKTYFFKAGLCYRFTGFQIDPGYPREINTEFPGVPNDIHAAVETGPREDQQTFFFKDAMAYRFDRDNGTVAAGYPKILLDRRNGLPRTVDAAVQWINTWTYFFKGERYYRWNYTQQRVADGYPRQISETWFGCSPTSERNSCWVRQCT